MLSEARRQSSRGNRLAMADSKIHHRIPIVGRPFLQRNEARLERDRALRDLARVAAERDEALLERDEALALRCEHKDKDSEETPAFQVAEKTPLSEEAEQETQTFEEESYRNPEFLNAPRGIAVGESIDDAEIIRRVVRAYKSDGFAAS